MAKRAAQPQPTGDRGLPSRPPEEQERSREGDEAVAERDAGQGREARASCRQLGARARAARAAAKGSRAWHQQIGMRCSIYSGDCMNLTNYSGSQRKLARFPRDGGGGCARGSTAGSFLYLCGRKVGPF